MGFADVLGTVGDALDKPRQMFYKGLNSVADSLGGNPEHEWKGFADVLGSAGMDPDSWVTKGLGFVGDIATDPLTWGGGLAAKGVRSFLGKGGQLGKAAAKGTGLARQAPVGEMLEHMPVFRNVVAGSPSQVNEAAAAMEAAGKHVVTTTKANRVGEHMAAEMSRGWRPPPVGAPATLDATTAAEWQRLYGPEWREVYDAGRTSAVGTEAADHTKKLQRLTNSVADRRKAGFEGVGRSEERRVGKECRSGWAQGH